MKSKKLTEDEDDLESEESIDEDFDTVVLSVKEGLFILEKKVHLDKVNDNLNLTKSLLKDWENKMTVLKNDISLLQERLIIMIRLVSYAKEVTSSLASSTKRCREELTEEELFEQMMGTIQSGKKTKFVNQNQSENQSNYNLNGYETTQVQNQYNYPMNNLLSNNNVSANNFLPSITNFVTNYPSSNSSHNVAWNDVENQN